MSEPIIDAAAGRLEGSELREAWALLLPEERMESLRTLARNEAEDVFLSLAGREQLEVVQMLPASERRSWLRLLDPDDAADVIQSAPAEERAGLMELLDPTTNKEVQALLAYAEDEAGGLMNPRYARLRPEMTVYEAISYLRRQAMSRVETIYYSYVLDSSQVLVGVVSFRQLFQSDATKMVREVMTGDIVSVREDMDQEAVSRILAQHDLMAVPVVDSEGRMKGIVTADDIVDVVQEAATEDMHKISGMEALGAPYLEIGFWPMVRKRAGWLAILFVGEMLTATAMGRFEDEIAKAVVLALFVPLIISSGGNAGSQATTLVIRALALGEARPRDWWRILRRELMSGLALGSILAAIGLARIAAWQAVGNAYGDHWLLLGMTVAASLVGVVCWGTLSGSMLPVLLKRLGFDPATASAPFVATLVDVTGLVIYFEVARLILSGTML